MYLVSKPFTLKNATWDTKQGCFFGGGRGDENGTFSGSFKKMLPKFPNFVLGFLSSLGYMSLSTCQCIAMLLMSWHMNSEKARRGTARFQEPSLLGCPETVFTHHREVRHTAVSCMGRGHSSEVQHMHFASNRLWVQFPAPPPGSTAEKVNTGAPISQHKHGAWLTSGQTPYKATSCSHLQGSCQVKDLATLPRVYPGVSIILMIRICQGEALRRDCWEGILIVLFKDLKGCRKDGGMDWFSMASE